MRIPGAPIQTRIVMRAINVFAPKPSPDRAAEIKTFGEEMFFASTRDRLTADAGPVGRRGHLTGPGYSCATTLAIDHAIAAWSEGIQLPP